MRSQPIGNQNLDHMVHYQPNKEAKHHSITLAQTVEQCSLYVKSQYITSKKEKKRKSKDIYDLNNIPQYEATLFSNMQFTIVTNIMRTLKRKKNSTCLFNEQQNNE